MIKIKHLYKTFSNNQELFQDFNFSVEEGENVALIGPSGCGKSTILRYILAMKFPDKGDVIIDGKNVALLKENELSQLRLNFGMLFQSAALFDSLSVEENIAFPLIENYGFNLSDCINKVNYVLELVGLEGFNQKMPYQLSGGQKKRIGLARAIVTEPKYLFFDEPTAGLDPITTTTVENVIIRLNEVLKTTTIVVSHEKSTILRTAKKIFMIHNNALLDFETPDTISNTENSIIKDFMKG
ncbi:MAG: ATP-binding cassette domain-containing protein [Candidatus Margulisiibacteriota bacterium]